MNKSCGVIKGEDTVIIRYGGYDLDVYDYNREGSIYVSRIKTTRQRNFRGVEQYLRELRNEKVNQVDYMLERYSRAQPGERELIEQTAELLGEIGIKKEDVIEEFRKKKLQDIKEKQYR